MLYQKFYKHLELKPNDFELRSIFADWLFDNNMFELEKAQRWMIENKKYPQYARFGYVFGTLNNEPNIHYRSCCLPDFLYKKLNGEHRNSTDVWKFWDTLKEAELELSRVV